MKIESSSIAMSSAHQESSYTHVETLSMEGTLASDLPGAILTISSKTEGKDAKSYVESLQEYKKQQEEKAAEQVKKQRENLAKLMSRNKKPSGGVNFEASEEFQRQIDMLRRLFEKLMRGKVEGSDIKSLGGKNLLDLRSPGYRGDEAQAASGGITLAGASASGGAITLAGASASGAITLAGASASSEASASAGIAVSGGKTVFIGTSPSTGTTWQRVTATSGFHSESESTTFATQGTVQTADGRSISFGMEVSMSRAFTQSIDKLDTVSYIKTDPLMINLDSDVGSVSDRKFLFDLDADGEEENISFAGKGSGFLALDKNGDGKINDGSELFGTKSGDGFKDLAAYDEDGNGWIDENDSVFDKLKVWTKDDDGNDILLDLKKADVGAIYLGNVDTQFSLKDDDNRLNAEIKKTGIFLHESSGRAGTLNHVDLAV